MGGSPWRGNKGLCRGSPVRKRFVAISVDHQSRRVVAASVKHETWQRYRAELKKFVTWVEDYAEVPITQVHLNDALVMRYLNIFLEAGLSYSKANKVRSAIVKMCSVFQKEQFLHTRTFKDYLVGFRKLTAHRRKDRKAITQEHLKTLLEYTALHLKPEIARVLTAAFIMGYYCLFRISELLQIRKVSFSDPNVMTYIIDFPTKTEVGQVTRAITLPPNVYVFLKQFWGSRTDRAVFGNLGRELPNKLIQACFARMGGFWSFHSLRHGRARDLYCIIPLERVMFFGRWRSRQSALLYIGHVRR